MDKIHKHNTAPLPKASLPDNHDENEIKAKQLIEQIRLGHQEAFADLVNAYQSQVASLAFRMVSDYDEAADITQDVFVKVSKNLWRFDEKKKFYTWLYRITQNATIDYIRKHKRHRHEPLEHFHHIGDSKSKGTDSDYIRHQIDRHIQQAASSLNDKQRTAFLLRDVEGCKIDDVANIMDMPEATVRWYLHRARNRMRRELSKRCPQLLLLLGIG